ncbi:PEP-CTERM sorting domain-containing protein [Chamaesiphon sp. VAR_48_metabat_403]|uniref:PEP-CTERM sorting domain-containing protein n=1 Tax=Chamaesiphon sp. VAR_48_metabat_403 TaxID=2964700 RepID=UPI00286DBCE5|nr:PEP-CTERM sorting domain-containing protein [Chamaesiphon sp. VAR_48_metabat_403]
MKIESIAIRSDNLKKRIFACKSFLFLLTGASLLAPSPSLAFSINRSEGQIEFSVRPVLPITPPVRSYDSTTSPTSVKDGLLTPNRGYPLISEASPLAPVQKKDGPISPPLSDVWTVNPPGKGTANITLQAIAFPTVAGIIWNGDNIFLNDLVNDGNAVRNASFGSANFKTTVGALYTELAFLNVQGGIYTERPDPWVTGSLIGKFNDAAKPHTLEILFGYDGKDRGREDFITAFLDGIEQPSNSGNFTGNLFAGANTFSASGVLLSNDFFPLNIGDNVSIEGTFSCVAFNGYCGGNGGFDSQQVPEPSAVLGTFTTAVLGAGLLIKRKLKKKLDLVSFDLHSKD